MRKFHENLKSLRESRGLTQEALGAKIGLAKSTISMYESGNREPSFEIIEVLADYFNVNVSILMGAANPSHSPLSSEEERLLSAYRALNAEGRRYILQTMHMAADAYGEPRVCNDLDQ